MRESFTASSGVGVESAEGRKYNSFDAGKRHTLLRLSTGELNVRKYLELVWVVTTAERKEADATSISWVEAEMLNLPRAWGQSIPVYPHSPGSNTKGSWREEQPLASLPDKWLRRGWVLGARRVGGEGKQGSKTAWMSA